MLKIFEGKTPVDRNKTIAALVLGAMALLAIVYNIVGLYPSRKPMTVTVSVSPSPTASPKTNLEPVSMPTNDEQIFGYTTTPVIYNPGSFYAPDAGRNIFAFYEPPPPTPYVAPPVVFRTPTPIPPPKPAPTPPLLVAFVTPQSVYAGSKTFRMEVSGDKFTPDSVILFNGTQLPTTFISPQKLVADVPSNFITNEGAVQIMIQTPDGKLFSNTFTLNVEGPPRPEFQYIGMIARKRANNDTAYFQEKNKPAPFGARLNDVVAGRFRLVSISSSEVVLEDISLSFRHKLALYRPAPGQSASTSGGNTNPSGTYNPNNQGIPTYNIPPQGEIPGIPNNIPRYIPPQPQLTPKPDDDDDGDN